MNKPISRAYFPIKYYCHKCKVTTKVLIPPYTTVYCADCLAKETLKRIRQSAKELSKVKV